MTPALDQQPVQTLLPQRAHEALGMRVGVWRPERRAYDLDPSVRNTSSRAPLNLAPRSWIGKRIGVNPAR
jgi:hypothetical protein